MANVMKIGELETDAFAIDVSIDGDTRAVLLALDSPHDVVKFGLTEEAAGRLRDLIGAGLKVLAATPKAA